MDMKCTFCLQQHDGQPLHVKWEILEIKRSSLLEFKVAIISRQLKQLRHLYLPEECSRKTKLKLGTLKDLQTLVNFNTKNCYVKDLINMTNLRELEIRGPFNMEDFNMEELDKNPPIIQKAFIGEEMLCSAQCFPKLESLNLIMHNNLKEWKVGEGAMPSLQRLKIQACEQLKKLPDGLRFIATLQELKIRWMPNTIEDRVKEGGEDFCKVLHVPTIIFQ
ncbi:hypothetical protein PVK06_041455 [Gossypium arboreum]|uniref:Uncharacterized protein n=1 Tax=Gossypium arboreum TaxID=29729 RepID=A0ABR0NB27_GOSAR|nr:hypothetical protein PVK06_041455 [Gossypium arboreum]